MQVNLKKTKIMVFQKKNEENLLILVLVTKKM